MKPEDQELLRLAVDVSELNDPGEFKQKLSNVIDVLMRENDALRRKVGNQRRELKRLNARERLVLVGASRGLWAEHAQEVQDKFHSLAKCWESETSYMSSVSQVCQHACYQRIIGLGPSALGPILRDLENTHRHWFHALYAITGENPVTAGDEGNIPLMVAAWVSWGRANGYLETKR